MAKNKTQPTQIRVTDFLDSTVPEGPKRADSERLIALMQSVSGQPPYMYGPSIIGFGSYSYTYASGHQGTASLLGFSPRKNAISLYVYTGLEEHRYLLEGLGKFTMGKACIYAKRLKDIDLEKLVTLMRATMAYMQEKYP